MSSGQKRWWMWVFLPSHVFGCQESSIQFWLQDSSRVYGMAQPYSLQWFPGKSHVFSSCKWALPRICCIMNVETGHVLRQIVSKQYINLLFSPTQSTFDIVWMPQNCAWWLPWFWTMKILLLLLYTESFIRWAPKQMEQLFNVGSWATNISWTTQFRLISDKLLELHSSDGMRPFFIKQLDNWISLWDMATARVDMIRSRLLVKYAFGLWCPWQLMHSLADALF